MIFFPTYASYDEPTDTWAVDLHAWAFRVATEPGKREVVSRMFRRALGLKPEDASSEVYQRRAALFLVDVVKYEPMTLTLGGRDYPLGSTRKSGHLEATLHLPGPLVRQHAGDTPRLTFAAPDVDLLGTAVRLIPPRGVSVISDIDDTIKASYVWKKRKLIKTTFTRAWKPTKGLASVYQSWADAGALFHYVSTSPWQLYPELDAFRDQHGFPDGTFHLKRFRWKDRSFFDLFTKAAKYKPKLIEPTLQRFPHRRFILLGDSGEADPEVYAQLAQRFPVQIAAVLIRDVAGLGPDHPRIASAFAHLPRDRWQLFDKAKQLRTPGVLHQLLAAGDAPSQDSQA